MSIRGIDTQIMITRTADTARDTSALQRHPQLAQESMAAQTKTESVHNQSRVQATVESENENIRTDVDGEGSGAAGGGGGGGGSEEEMTEEQERELLVAPAKRQQIIDIMV